MLGIRGILVRLLRGLAVAAAIHGLLFAAAAYLVFTDEPTWGPSLARQIYFYGLVMPAMILAMPFTKLLWELGLMHTPGWFAWPKPLGFVLVYACWIAALRALAWLTTRKKMGRPKAPRIAP